MRIGSKTECKAWKIYGKDITDAAGDIDFDVTAGADAGKSMYSDIGAFGKGTGGKYQEFWRLRSLILQRRML